MNEFILPLQVKLGKRNGTEDIMVARGDNGDTWHLHKLSVTNEVHFVQFVAMKGIGDGTLAIDDVHFTEDLCIGKYWKALGTFTT